MKRREFIILSSVGAASASLLSACGHPEEKLIPAFIPDEEFVPGIDYWKASTCGMCSAGCGIIVRTREHKANKIEGNPLHPVNRGALCARGQAGLEVLYNPDRIKGPMKRVGERGEGKWQEISWEEGIKTLTDKLREIDPSSTTDKALFVSHDAEGVTAYVAGRLMQAYRQAFTSERSDGSMGLRSIYPEHLRGITNHGEPIFDIANATFLLSFGARFLETWKSPVMYSQAYGEFRSSRGKPRGRFVHVEPRMSLTAANADEWIAAAPRSEAQVALAMVQVIVREGLNKAPLSAASIRDLEEYSPENAFQLIDVPAERIVRVAREFAKAERPLAIGDLGVGTYSAAVNLLNAIVLNLNKPGGVRLVEEHSESISALKAPNGGLIFPGETTSKVDKPLTWEVIDERSIRYEEIAGLRYRLMMIHGFNPVFESPMFGKESWREKLAATPFIVSFSSFLDETSELADLILPDDTYLERWDAHAAYGPDGKRVVSLTQPVIERQFETRQTADVLLAVARELGGEVSNALRFDSAKEIVEKSALDLMKRVGSEGTSADWAKLTETGVGSAVMMGSATALRPADQAPMSLNLSYFGLRRNPLLQLKSAEYPFTLIVDGRGTFGDGSAANLPSIQELPDPMTSVMWGSWIEINPKAAEGIGIVDGDLVEITTHYGSLRAPAVLYPGIRPDCIAMPLGQGHSSFGRYARGRGVHPATLFLEATEQNASPARLTKVGGKSQLIRFGTDLQEHMEKKAWR